MNPTTTLTEPVELDFRLHGGLYEPGEPAYEDACVLFNSMITKRPRYVARCAAPDDVIAAIAFARSNDLPLAVRAGGHSVAGLSLREDGLVLDLRPIDEIVVDPERRTVRVGGGAVWADVDAATQKHGLATTGGRVSSTGVAGLTLGGGSGWLERKHGLTCDNLLAAELVTADGRLVRASATENRELLWALKGGGGNFGVVTAMEFRLHPVGPEVFGGIAVYPLEHGRELLRRYRDVMVDAPDGLSLAFIYLTVPPEPEFPAERHGQVAVAVAGMYAGDIAEGEEAMRAIREPVEPIADLFGPVPYAEFQSSLDDPPGYRNWWTAEYLADLTDDAIDAIAARSETMKPGAAQIFIAGWGGAVARAPRGSTPLAGRDAKFVVHPLLLWEDPAEDEEMIAFGRGYRADLKPWATGVTYLNFIGDEGRSRVRNAFGASYERLVAVKSKWDPRNVFDANQNIVPRPPGSFPQPSG